MRPETMHSFQIGATYHRQGKPLSAELSFYRNKLEDLVNIELGGEYLFRNSAMVTQAGIEGAVQYNTDNFFATRISHGRSSSSQKTTTYIKTIHSECHS